MYSVVGCGACRALWIVEGRPETTRCSRCGKRHRFEKLKTFTETDDADAAARVRSAMLADRSDEGEFLDPAEIDVDAIGVDDAEYLEASGLDSEVVSEAGERASSGVSGRSRSRKQVVLDGIDDLEEPTAETLREYATDVGVPGEYVDRALAKLSSSGAIVESDGVYRRL